MIRNFTAFSALALFFCLVIGAAPMARAQGPFVNFESPQSQHALVVDGDRLYVVNTPDNRLSVFDLTVSPPALLAEIAVGLDPVAVAARPGHPGEVWVVNHLSDDVTVVDVNLGVALWSIAVPNEPADILFTNDGARAYVSCSEVNQVVSIDAATRLIDKTFDIAMEEPRGLGMSANGRFLVISILESGNRTTIIPADEAPPSDPQVGLIVPDSDPRAHVVLPDKDLWIIKTRSNRLLNKTVKGIGTINFGVGVSPFNNRVYVPNTEALNLIQFEPNLRGHFIDSRVTIIEKTPTSIDVTPVDLNPTIDYDILPNPAAQAIALSQPTAVEFDPADGDVFVAAFGSGRVAVLDEDGAILNRIEVGEGPRALAFDGTRRDLHVLNRLDNSVTTIDADTETVTSTVAIGRDGFDPTPEVILNGRRFLYDAGLSGNGTGSCAACHIDATADHLSWDLGDPDGEPTPGFAAAKGPMFTQSLRDLGGTEPYHWRGDRPEFTDFDGAFESLMGAATPLDPADMQAFEDYIFTVKYPPNPLQMKDRSLTPTSQAALDLFQDPTVFGGFLSCADCHGFPFGEAPVVIPGSVLQESQGFNPGLLMGLNEKTGFEETGFAFLHDGSEPTIQDFLSTSPPFPFFTIFEKNNFNELSLQWDTGIAPSVGRRITIDSTNASDPAVTSIVVDLTAEALLVHVDVVAHGLLNGDVRGMWYDPRIDRFVTDRAGDPALTLAQLKTLASGGNAAMTVTAVPAGSGPRIGIDRDCDTLFDGDEAALGTNPRDADSDGDSHLDGVEVAAGSDPLDAGSVPATTSNPVITTATPVVAAPWPGFERLTVSGTDIRLGAVLEATGGSGDVNDELLFPIGPNTWAIYLSLDQSLGSTWSGLTLRVRNLDGGLSAPFVVP